MPMLFDKINRRASVYDPHGIVRSKTKGPDWRSMIDRFASSYVEYINKQLSTGSRYTLFELKETCNYKLQQLENHFMKLFFTPENNLTNYVKNMLGYDVMPEGKNVPFLKSRIMMGLNLTSNCYLWIHIQWLAQLCNPDVDNKVISKKLSKWAYSNPLEVIGMFQHLYLIEKFAR